MRKSHLDASSRKQTRRECPAPGAAWALRCSRSAGCDLQVGSRAGPGLGSHGIKPGHLHKPRVAAFDAQDQLYLADLTDRIQVFDRDGKYLRGWRTPEFNVDGPSGLTVDRLGRLLVADTHFYRVLVYSSDGELLFQIGDGVQGTTPGRFGYPTDVVIDRAGNFYVAEYGENDRIQVFSPEGKWLRQWGGHGYEPGEFLKPRALAIDEQDRLFVADSCNHRIQVFDTQGKLLEFVGLARRRTRADELSLRPGDRPGPLPLRLRVRQPPRPEVRRSTGKSLGTWGSRRPRAGAALQSLCPGRRQPGQRLGHRLEQPSRPAFGCKPSGFPAAEAGSDQAERDPGATSMMLGNWSITVGNPWWLILIPLVLPPLIW